MSLWLVRKYYDKDDKPYYDVAPHSFWGHIECCYQWYGLKGLKHAYLSEKKANRVAEKLTQKALKEYYKNKGEEILSSNHYCTPNNWISEDSDIKEDQVYILSVDLGKEKDNNE